MTTVEQDQTVVKERHELLSRERIREYASRWFRTSVNGPKL